MKNKVKLYLFILYTANLLYFSLNTFIGASLANKASRYYIFPQYNSIVNGDNIIGRVFYTLRLNAAYSFFGKGLGESVEVNFDFYDKNRVLLKKAKFAHGFTSGSGQIRANTLSNRISYSLISKIEIKNNQLKTKGNTLAEVQIQKKGIEHDNQILDEYLRRMGLFVAQKINGWSTFDANIYFILPSKIGIYNGKNASTLRKYYLYKRVRFVSVQK